MVVCSKAASRITDEEPYHVLLDEIQFVERFPEVLNSLLRMDHVDIYVTESNSRFLASVYRRQNICPIYLREAFFIDTAICFDIREGNTFTRP